MTYPVFATGDVLPASDMNAIGLWLVKTQTVGTGVSSVQVTGAFNSSFDNYRITWTGGTMSAATVMRMTLGATATGYYAQLIYAPYAGTAALANVPDNNAVRWSYAGAGNTNYASVRVNLYNPNLSTRTLFHAEWADDSNAGTNNGFLNDATQYTAFTLAPASGTITGGTIRVYGYRN